MPTIAKPARPWRRVVGLLTLMVFLALFPDPAAAQQIPDGGAETNEEGDGVDLWAIDAIGGQPPGPGSGCGLWEPARAHQLWGVPPSMLVGLDPATGLIRHTGLSGVTAILHVRLCPGGTVPWEYRFFDETDGLAPLIVAARDMLLLPAPVPNLSPPAERTSTLVGVATWFWVPAEQWTARSATVTAGAVSVTASARPALLRFDPGDGSLPIDCAGPGIPWALGATSTCSHHYVWTSAHHPSGRWPARLETVWEVTWSATTGAGGVLDPIVRSTDLPVRVAEAVAVIGRPERGP